MRMVVMFWVDVSQVIATLMKSEQGMKFEFHSIPV